MDSILPGLDAAPNIHPIFVHFPIAFWLGALLFYALGVARQRDDFFTAGRWLLYVGTASAALAVGTGFWATEKMGHDTPGHELIHVHRDFMLVTTGLAVATTILAFIWRRSASKAVRWTQVGLLGATIAVMTLGTDRGAELVYRYGIGVAGEQPPETQDHEHSHDDDEHEDAEAHAAGEDATPPSESAPSEDRAVQPGAETQPSQEPETEGRPAAKGQRGQEQHDHHDHDHAH